MEKNNPLVYIVLPVYNWEKYFLEQLMCLYFQNYTNWYLIIVNDWSTDNSETIARDWISHYNLHEKVKILYKDNWWLNSAITRWLEEVKNMCNINKTDSLVCYCDCDDVWTREKLNEQVNYMVNNIDCWLSYHDLAQIDENDILKNSSILKWKYKWDKSFLCISTMGAWMIATEMMFRAKYIDDILPMPLWKEMMQDYWTAMVLAYLWVKIWYIDKVLWYYRVWHSSFMKSWLKKDIKKISDRYINILNYFKIRFPDADLDKIIHYNEDIHYNWVVNKYWFLRRVFLKIFKYPKIFVIELKEFIYEKLQIILK